MRKTHFLQGLLGLFVQLLLLIRDVVVPGGRQAGAHWDGVSGLMGMVDWEEIGVRRLLRRASD